VYVIQKYNREYFGWNNAGYCEDENAVCYKKFGDMTIFEAINYTQMREVPSVVIVTMMTAVLNFYYWQQAKLLHHVI